MFRQLAQVMSVAFPDIFGYLWGMSEIAVEYKWANVMHILKQKERETGR